MVNSVVDKKRQDRITILYWFINQEKVPCSYFQLSEMLHHPEVEEKPVLIVGTKMDKDGALDEESLFNVYDLDTVLADNR